MARPPAWCRRPTVSSSSCGRLPQAEARNYSPVVVLDDRNEIKRAA